MPEVVFYEEENGTVPFLDWMGSLPEGAVDRCRAAIVRLKELGFLLRRPTADLLDDGIYELRIRYRRVNYRILYFFHGQQAVVTHGFAKRRAAVPGQEIVFARERRRRFQFAPRNHSHREE